MQMAAGAEVTGLNQCSRLLLVSPHASGRPPPLPAAVALAGFAYLLASVPLPTAIRQYCYSECGCVF
jgi:hypothetical protein